MDRVEALLLRLGAEPTRLGSPHPVAAYGPGVAERRISSRTVYRYRGWFYRVDEVLFPEKPFLVLECAGRQELVQSNTMEDADPFPYDMREEELLVELRETLEKEP